MIYMAIWAFPAKIRFLADLAGNRPDIDTSADLANFTFLNRSESSFLVSNSEGLLNFDIDHDISILKQRGKIFFVPRRLQ